MTDGNYKNALATVRELSLEGHETHVVGRPSSITRFSRSTKHFHRADDAGALRAMLLGIADGQIDCVIPVGAASVFLLDSLREEISQKLAFAIGPKNSMALAQDKFALQEFGESIGVKSPKSWRFSNPESLRSQLSSLPLPLVIKSVSHLDSSRPIYIKSSEDRNDFIKSEALNPSFLLGDVEVQEYIEGSGEGFFSLYQNGECKRTMMHRRLGETPPTGGSSWAAKSISEQDLDLLGRRLLDGLNWHGPAMVEFKRRTDDGKLFLMELNPKLWGSLDLTIATGFKVPSDTVRVAIGEELAPDFIFSTGVHFWWPLDSWEALFGRKKIESNNVESNVELRDPLPTIIGFFGLVLQSLLSRSREHWAAKFIYWWWVEGPRYALERCRGELWGLPSRQSSEVTPFLWVGAQPSRLGRFLLHKLHQREPYSLLGGFSGDKKNGKSEEIRGTPMPEFVEIPLELLTKALQEISEVEARGERIYVHCREGVGRAPTVAVAWLMSLGVPRLEAIATVESRRRIARLTELQKATLLRYEKELFLRRS